MKLVAWIVVVALFGGLMFVQGQAFERRRFAPLDARVPSVEAARDFIIEYLPNDVVAHDAAFASSGPTHMRAMGVRDDSGEITSVTNGDFVAFRMDADGYVFARCK